MPPEPFETENKFLRYCDIHSQSERALFSGEHINYLYELAGMDSPYNVSELKNNPFAAIYPGQMDEILKRIKIRKNSIEDKCEEVEEISKEPDNVIYLDDYR